MTDQDRSAISPDALDHAREVVAKMTPGRWEAINARPDDAPEWVSVMKFIRAPDCVVENDRGPSYATEVLSDEDYPTKDGDLEGIVLATAALRVLTDEGTVEALARALHPRVWETFDAYKRDAERKGDKDMDRPGRWQDNHTMALARACLTRILELAQGEK